LKGLSPDHAIDSQVRTHQFYYETWAKAWILGIEMIMIGKGFHESICMTFTYFIFSFKDQAIAIVSIAKRCYHRL